MLIKRKVAFDFDSTLDRESVQKYAAELIERGYEVWIVTARPEVYNGRYVNFEPSNDDLFKVADELGILREHIEFRGYQLKCDFLNGEGFIFLLDDDYIELRHTIKYTKCDAIQSLASAWKTKCERSLNKNLDWDILYTSILDIEEIPTGAIRTKRQWMELLNISAIKFNRLLDENKYFK